MNTNIWRDFQICISVPLIGKIRGSKNNYEKSSTTKVIKDITSGFSMSTISSFKDIENKHNKYRGKDCVKTFNESLKGHFKV